MAKEKNAFRGQYDGEEVLFVFRKHPVVMRKGLILFMIAVLLGTVPSFIKPELSYFYIGKCGVCSRDDSHVAIVDILVL